MTLRVLQVVGGLGVGGTETWLAKGLRYVDRGHFHFDFLVHPPTSLAYRTAVEEHGGEVLEAPGIRNPAGFAWQLWRILRARKYPAIHAHNYCSGAFALLVAKWAGVPIRVFHSHTAQSEREAKGWRGVYFRLARWVVQHCATRGVAVSEEAARPWFPRDWRERPERWTISPCGIDLEVYTRHADRQEVRREFGIPEDAVLAVHVGRFVEVKNHRLLVAIAEAAAAKEMPLKFLLVGDGPERAEIERTIHERGLQSCFVSAGVRADVPRLLAAGDVFVFPSHYEGFPLAYVEAQVAGLPCVISDQITPEADFLPKGARRLSLNASAEEWADALVAAAREERVSSGQERFAAVSLERSMQRLVGCYR